MLFQLYHWIGRRVASSLVHGFPGHVQGSLRTTLLAIRWPCGRRLYLFLVGKLLWLPVLFFRFAGFLFKRVSIAGGK